jgi:hypothetical protein
VLKDRTQVIFACSYTSLSRGGCGGPSIKRPCRSKPKKSIP